MTTDAYDPGAALCEVPVGDLFADDDIDEDPDEFVDEVYDQSGALRDGEYWQGSAAEDDDDETHDDD